VVENNDVPGCMPTALGKVIKFGYARGFIEVLRCAASNMVNRESRNWRLHVLDR
jgi:hypothetical protein